MKKVLTLILLVIACKTSSFGSHIVGGEFELLHLEDFNYRLNMILYFDLLNGAAGARDETVTVYIYRKSDNTFMRSIVLDLDTDANVPYSNPGCDDGRLSTSRILYTNTLTLAESIYNDPEGYYVSWERCCRNYNANGVQNIESAIPGTGGISAGQTFYLEFPPVTRNGSQFINSTPRLFPPLRDYGCPGNFYFVDFGGTDDDGDSLVYSMVTPYSTVDTQNAFPAQPNPGPYPEIVWREDYGLDNIIDGNPDLSISKDGLLSGTPQVAGLYVFAVKCEEFRAGQRIGEMRRDFQMLVVDGPCNNVTPEVRARELGSTGFYKEGSTLDFDNMVDDDVRCIEILVTDVPFKVNDLVSQDDQEISVKVIPLNFDVDVNDVTIEEVDNGPLAAASDTARFNVCFPKCPYVRGRPYRVGIVALDNACPQPALDTLEVSLNVEPPPNGLAAMQYARGSSGFVNNDNLVVQVVENESGSTTFDVRGIDPDGDDLIFDIIPKGFSFEDIGVTFTAPRFSPGLVNTEFTWEYGCKDGRSYLAGQEFFKANGNLARRFKALAIVDDLDECEFNDADTLNITFEIEFPGQTKPEIFESTRRNDDGPLRFTYRLRDRISHRFIGEDRDNDDLIITGVAKNFDLAQYNLSIPQAEGKGTAFSDFVWDLACDINLAEQDSFRLEYVVRDVDACERANPDTLAVDLIIDFPVSTPPNIEARSTNGLQIRNDSIGFVIGQKLDVNIIGREFEGDQLQLRLLNRSELPPDMMFEDATGIRQVTSALTWQPDCSIFTDSDFAETFTLLFSITDDNCIISQTNTLELKVHVEDVRRDEAQKIPPNVFTPNNDDINDFFAMVEKVGPDSYVNILPIDNCTGRFENIKIFNRWGKLVYESSDRDFRWDGEGISSGVYFYFIKFTNQEFQGTVSAIF